MGINLQTYSLRLVKEDGNRYKGLKKYINTPEDGYKVFMEVLDMDERAQEIFGLICLNIQNKVVGVFTVSKGMLSKSSASPRSIYQRAVLQNAAGIIIGHNHPSGDPSPSDDDKKITEKLVKAGEYLDIELLDHIIVGHSDFISMKERKLI